MFRVKYRGKVVVEEQDRWNQLRRSKTVMAANYCNSNEKTGGQEDRRTEDKSTGGEKGGIHHHTMFRVKNRSKVVLEEQDHLNQSTRRKTVMAANYCNSNDRTGGQEEGGERSGIHHHTMFRVQNRGRMLLVEQDHWNQSRERKKVMAATYCTIYIDIRSVPYCCCCE